MITFIDLTVGILVSIILVMYNRKSSNSLLHGLFRFFVTFILVMLVVQIGSDVQYLIEAEINVQERDRI